MKVHNESACAYVVGTHTEQDATNNTVQHCLLKLHLYTLICNNKCFLRNVIQLNYIEI